MKPHLLAFVLVILLPAALFGQSTYGPSAHGGAPGQGPGCNTIQLSGPFPGTPAAFNTLSIAGGTPGQTVYFVWGLAPGSTLVPGCGALCVDINAATPLGTDVVDASSFGDETFWVPAAASGVTVYFQAVHLAPVCCVSNLVVYTF